MLYAALFCTTANDTFFRPSFCFWISVGVMVGSLKMAPIRFPASTASRNTCKKVHRKCRSSPQAMPMRSSIYRVNTLLQKCRSGEGEAVAGSTHVTPHGVCANEARKRCKAGEVSEGLSWLEWNQGNIPWTATSDISVWNCKKKLQSFIISQGGGGGKT